MKPLDGIPGEKGTPEIVDILINVRRVTQVSRARRGLQRLDRLRNLKGDTATSVQIYEKEIEEMRDS